MNTDVRRKLDMADRVRDFSRAHPTEDPAYAALFARLDDRVARAAVLATQERAGLLTERSATARRRDLRRTMHAGLLRRLVRVSEVLAKEQPGFGDRFPLPSGSATNRAYATAARAIVVEAAGKKDLFLKVGLPEGSIDEIGRLLDQFGEAMDVGAAGRRDHVGARADLAAVTADIVAVVGLVDGLNRFRFRNDPELLAAWKSARNVVARHRATPGPVEEAPSPPLNGEAKAA